jgi:hypothetical protein
MFFYLSCIKFTIQKLLKALFFFIFEINLPRASVSLSAKRVLCREPSNFFCILAIKLFSLCSLVRVIQHIQVWCNFINIYYIS